ncbi:MAG: PhoH family protein [Sandaracinus sp.]|nr:PhoH family protein [Sandaracinus sp.]
MTQAKIFVLDTNVLLHDPQAIFKFEENTVVIPIYVIEEVDQFKKELSERGRNARLIARTLDELREKNGHSLQEGVDIAEGGRLIITTPGDPELWRSRDNRQMDHAILGTALELRDEHPDKKVIFVTMDSNLRIRADALGLRAENYEGGRLHGTELYTGMVRVTVPKEMVDVLGKRDAVELGELAPKGEMHPNAGVVLESRDQARHTALGRWDAVNQKVVPLRVSREGAWGIRPRNLEQTIALDLLLDPDIHLVTLVGKAGTGKTLLAVAAGLQHVLDDGTFARLVVSRPIFPLGRDVGYLPGTLEEKLNPWMQPIFDNLEYIFSANRRRMADHRDYQELVASGQLQIEPLTYIRGRSLPNQFLIVDEAQNLTPHEVKTVITRAGTGTKIILTGDPDQIDNPYVDSQSNGLTMVAERFRGESISAHVTLTKGERSELAERATQLL